MGMDLRNNGTLWEWTVRNNGTLWEWTVRNNGTLLEWTVRNNGTLLEWTLRNNGTLLEQKYVSARRLREQSKSVHENSVIMKMFQSSHSYVEIALVCNPDSNTVAYMSSTVLMLKIWSCTW